MSGRRIQNDHLEVALDATATTDAYATICTIDVRGYSRKQLCIAAATNNIKYKVNASVDGSNWDKTDLVSEQTVVADAVDIQALTDAYSKYQIQGKSAVAGNAGTIAVRLGANRA